MISDGVVGIPTPMNLCNKANHLMLPKKQHMNLVAEIKNRWPLTAMLARCGISIPERGKFPSPFRTDNNPSCEVYNDHIVDWSTGERIDSIGVYALRKNISNKEAIRLLAEELPNRRSKPIPKQKRLVIPKLQYTPEAAETLSKLRGISRHGIDLAATTIGSLGFGEALGHSCWILTDGKNIVEARRMDGLKFPRIGTLGERKSHTFAGSSKSWPIGITPQHGQKSLSTLPIVLVEGGPDYLAACDMAWHSSREFLPVAMLGSTSKIHDDALQFFKGREVLILAHPDESGVEGAKTWCNQLRKAKAHPRVKKLLGGDLNDLVKRDGAEAVAMGLLI
jgi:hypothetical protein